MINAGEKIMKNKIIFVLSSTLLVAAYASHNENYHSSDFNWNVGSGYIKSESDDDRYKLVKESNESDDAYERNRDNDSDHGNDRDNDNHDSGSDNDNHDD